MSDAIALYGTEAPVAVGERLAVGPLSFTLEQGGLRHIRVGAVEIIRGVGFLVRDRDWGTLAPDLELVERTVSSDRIGLHHGVEATPSLGMAELLGYSAMGLCQDGQPTELSPSPVTLPPGSRLMVCPLGCTSLQATDALSSSKPAVRMMTTSLDMAGERGGRPANR